MRDARRSARLIYPRVFTLGVPHDALLRLCFAGGSDRSGLWWHRAAYGPRRRGTRRRHRHGWRGGPRWFRRRRSRRGPDGRRNPRWGPLVQHERVVPELPRPGAALRRPEPLSHGRGLSFDGLRRILSMFRGRRRSLPTRRRLRGSSLYLQSGDQPLFAHRARLRRFERLRGRLCVRGRGVRRPPGALRGRRRLSPRLHVFLCKPRSAVLPSHRSALRRRPRLSDARGSVRRRGWRPEERVHALARSQPARCSFVRQHTMHRLPDAGMRVNCSGHACGLRHVWALCLGSRLRRRLRVSRPVGGLTVRVRASRWLLRRFA